MHAVRDAALLQGPAPIWDTGWVVFFLQLSLLMTFVSGHRCRPSLHVSPRTGRSDRKTFQFVQFEVLRVISAMRLRLVLQHQDKCHLFSVLVFVTLIMMSFHPDTCALRMAQVSDKKSSHAFQEKKRVRLCRNTQFVRVLQRVLLPCLEDVETQCFVTGIR